jgi:ABC-type transport system involved in multi-copper enzyme maturation permease subunit
MTPTSDPAPAATAEALLPAAPPSLLRAWCALALLCLQRQARARQMVWIALVLVAFTALVVGLVNLAGGNWTMKRYRWIIPRLRPELRTNLRGGGIALESAPGDRTTPPQPKDLRQGPPQALPIVTYEQIATMLEELPPALGPVSGPSSTALLQAMSGVTRSVLDNTALYEFSRWIIFAVFLKFLLPICSLSFATEALGGEREGRSLVWLLTRPMPRAWVYLAKFVGLLPWSLGLNLGGFALLCLLAGPPGRMALQLYWPAVLGGTFAFCALYHLMAACFRRAAVVALVYSFFLETILGSMPGLMKRVSVGFYTQCLMFDAAQDYGIQPEKPSIYLPVTGPTAWVVLAGLTVGLLVVGMVVFSRSEYQDLT